MKENCPICFGSTTKKSNFSFKCNNSKFYFSNLKPSAGKDYSGIENVRRKNFKKLISVIYTYKKKPEILEVGSGDGFFLDECSVAGISIIGSEASKKIMKQLKKKFNIELVEVSLPKPIPIKKKKFDIIIFNDVFEHISNLDKTIFEIKKLLKDDGLIFINLPTSDGIVFKISEILNNFGSPKLYNRLWQKGSSSPHISYFNRENLKLLFLKNNFELIESGNLETLSINNYDRFKGLFKSFPFTILFTVLTTVFYFLQFLLPRDIMYCAFGIKKE